MVPYYVLTDKELREIGELTINNVLKWLHMQKGPEWTIPRPGFFWLLPIELSPEWDGGRPGCGWPWNWKDEGDILPDHCSGDLLIVVNVETKQYSMVCEHHKGQINPDWRRYA